MTWREFKEAIEKLGVKDDTEIQWIDWSGNDDLEIFHKNDDGSVSIV